MRRQQRPNPTSTTTTTSSTAQKSSSRSAAASPNQAWAILFRHARDDITPLRLQELCTDNDRVSSLVTVHNSFHQNTSRTLLVDLSRQRMTLDTINHLLRLATSRDVRGFIRQLSWGQNDPDDPISLRETKKKQLHQNQNFPSTNVHKLSNSPSMHLALRVPRVPDQQYSMLLRDGKNALEAIHLEWEKIEKYSNHIRNGQIPSMTKKSIRDVIVVGKGVPIMALKFINHALQHDGNSMEARWFSESSSSSKSSMKKNTNPTNLISNVVGGNQNSRHYREMRFITSDDPIVFEKAIEGLQPESTIVVVLDIQHNDPSTSTNLSNDGIALNTIVGFEYTIKALHSWLSKQKYIDKYFPIQAHNSKNRQQSLHQAQQRSEAIIKYHFVLITTSLAKARKQYSKQMSFVLPDHSQCEAFTTFTAAGLLPLSIVFGWDFTLDIIAGAHDMDRHFVDTNPRHNIPILLALCDVWNTILFGGGSNNSSHMKHLHSSKMSSSSCCGRIMTPFSDVLREFVPFVAALESQTCAISESDNDNSNSNTTKMNRYRCSPGLIIQGSAHGEYDRILYQGESIIPCELLAVMDTQVHSNDGHDHTMSESQTQAQQDAFICDFFAHADVLAFGNQMNESLDHGYGSYGRNGMVTNLGLNGQLSSEGVEVDPFAEEEMDFFSSSPSVPSISSNHPNNNNNSNLDAAEGNRPSTLLMCGSMDAFTCGQLVALSEHRAAVAARIWDVNPFVKQVGSSMRAKETLKLKGKLSRIYELLKNGMDLEEEVEKSTGNVNLATLTILTHYANRMYGQNSR